VAFCPQANYGEAAEKFVREFKDFVDKKGFIPEQVFNCDETGLFWKKMPKRTYITKEEKALPGHKPMKYRLTLFLCGNTSGDESALMLLDSGSSIKRPKDGRKVPRQPNAFIPFSKECRWKLATQYPQNRNTDISVW
jgi:hypothetical protein